MAAPLPIRSYALFGESGELPDVLHCETIAARSALHGWELAPHRHARLHQLLLLTRGGGQVRLESGVISLAPRMLVNVPAGDVHAFRFVPGTDGWVVTLPDERLADARGPLGAIGATAAPLAQACVTGAERAIERTMAAIAREFGGRAEARALALRGLALQLLALAARAVAATAPVAAELPASNLLRRFERLLDTHALEHWSIAAYARALAVSPTHLSRVTRAATGRSASRLVDERVMREARRNLVFSSLPIKSVAYALGFADPAHFSRRFTQVVGCSPRAFRQRLG